MQKARGVLKNTAGRVKAVPSAANRRLAIRILKKLLPRAVVKPFLPIYHLLRAMIANLRYGFPARKLKVIGITGTNGKTTTAHYIASILEAAGYKVGMSTTTTFKVGEKEADNEINMTVANPFAIQRLLKEMRTSKVDWLVLEVTAHSLSQNRLWGIPFHTAVFTNLTQDHLDYYQTMDNYATAKAKLFKHATQNAVLNHDDEWFNFFSQVASQHKYTYGVNADSDVRLIKANLRPNSTQITFQLMEKGVIEARLNLAGKFNVYNALAAASVGAALELSPEIIKKGLERVHQVPGRMEVIRAGQKFTVIVDYAHSPDALRNLFETLRPLTRGRLITVFGATGDRDKLKRPLMGTIAAKNTNIAIVTDDEPYTENPKAIRADVLEGAKMANAECEIIEIGDRRAAIAKAYELAKADDTVAILGMGHEKFRVIGTKRVPWDERKIAYELLKARKRKTPRSKSR